jgi:hypothetical protein
MLHQVGALHLPWDAHGIKLSTRENRAVPSTVAPPATRPWRTRSRTPAVFRVPVFGVAGTCTSPFKPLGRRRKLRAALRRSAGPAACSKAKARRDSVPLVVGLGDQFEPYRCALPC